MLSFLVLLAAVSASEVHIIEGNDGMNSFVQGVDLSLVEFYAPWCGHCKKLAPEFDEAALALKEVGVKLAKVDCTADENKDLCARFGITGYPTLKIFRRNGSETVYDGPRDAQGIITFLTKQTQAPFAVLSDAEAVLAFKRGKLALLAVFEAQDSEYEAFVATAAALRADIDFGVVVDPSLGEVPGITLYKTFDAPTVAFQGEVTQEALTEFVLAESFPLLGEIGPENYQKYSDRGLPYFWFFLDPEAAETAELEAAAERVAARFKGEISFVKLDGVKWRRHAKNFGLTSTPGLAIQFGKHNYLYPESDDVDAFSEANIQAFAQGFVEGSVKPNLKSQDEPESNDGPVWTLVGSTFEAMVTDPAVDVLVEFYAPWCGHCKQLTPKYEALGKLFAEVDSVVIAKLDATENDVSADIKGFPTLVFYPASGEEMVYNGDRTTAAMAAFIRENASIKIQGEAGVAVGHEEL